MTGKLHKIPLRGVLLIEAGAGTGKTYTITNLYVRLLLGIECGRVFQVQELLVLTFTRAATQELRYRVTRRIQEARQAFQNGGSEDDFLNDVVTKSADRERDRKLLTAAIQLMDEAAILTIHGFCARVLRDQSFEAGTLFDQNINEAANGDREHILRLACEDCFRNDVLTLEPVIRSIALSLWATPGALARQLTPLLYRGQLTLLPPLQQVDFDVKALVAKIRKAREGWLQHGLEAVIEACNLHKGRMPFKKRQEMTTFCQSIEIDWQAEYWSIYSKSALEASMTAKSSMPQHPVLDLIDEISHGTGKIPKVKTNLWHTMTGKVQERIRRTREEQYLLTVDALLTSLADALTARGSTLGETLAARWPVAMVDEYQDTDDIQSRIFENIYHRNDDQHDLTLVMIGDPRQAIYQFRGADVYTYINARRQVEKTAASNIHTLDTNWRSSALIVAANNYLFRQPGIFGDKDEIRFTEVKAAPEHDRMAMSINGVKQTPYQIFCPGSTESPLSVDQAREATMNYAAEETAQLLLGARAKRVLVNGEPLAAGNIAFLIRNRRDARFAKAALARRGITSVYLTQESVLLQDTAEDLKLILQAAAEPTSDRAIRAALGTRLMQCSADEIDRLNDDLTLQQEVAQEFQTYHDIWAKKNVGAMINALTVTRRLGGKWLALPDGERLLTDLRHLTDILQSGAAAAPGFHQLLAWFIQERQAAKTADNEQRQLRLESDENLVKIVTMHSAKGLEYDLVMIPYPAFPFDRCKKSPALFHAKKDNRFNAFVELGDDANHRDAAAAEVSAEEMRLCYVALTRAKYRCYLGVPTLNNRQEKKLIRGAFGRLMQLGKKPGEIKDFLMENLPNHLFEVVPADKVAVTRVALQTDQAKLTPAPPLPLISDRWRMHSYSGIVNSHGGNIKNIGQTVDASADIQSGHLAGHLAGHSVSDAVRNGVSVIVNDATSPVGGYSDDEPPEDRTRTGNLAVNSPSRFTFPSGARIGVALHSLLEDADFADKSQHGSLCLRTLERIGLEEDRDAWLKVLQEWLADILHTPLFGKEFSEHDETLTLSTLAATDRLDELEFHFPVSCRGGITELLKSNQYPGARPLPTSLHLEGMMTGFIDLVFRHDGKYYLADYKSNHLGYEFATYTGHDLEQAMMESRYDLQYLIYTLALNRFLTLRLSGYDYERDFGGVFYLFLRGMDGKSNDFGIYFDKPEATLIKQLDGLMGARP